MDTQTGTYTLRLCWSGSFYTEGWPCWGLGSDKEAVLWGWLSPWSPRAGRQGRRSAGGLLAPPMVPPSVVGEARLLCGLCACVCSVFFFVCLLYVLCLCLFVCLCVCVCPLVLFFVFHCLLLSVLKLEGTWRVHGDKFHCFCHSLVCRNGTSTPNSLIWFFAIYINLLEIKICSFFQWYYHFLFVNLIFCTLKEFIMSIVLILNNCFQNYICFLFKWCYQTTGIIIV